MRMLMRELRGCDIGELNFVLKKSNSGAIKRLLGNYLETIGRLFGVYLETIGRLFRDYLETIGRLL